LEKALNTPGPVLIEMKVAREENVFPIVPAGAALKEMILQ
jgi:acetolactate synthase I/II/III large subunit